MALPVLDATGVGGWQGTGATTWNWPHTCTGSNLKLLVAVFVRGLDNNPSASVTYNSVAMTEIGTAVTAGGVFRGWLFELNGPATGTNNVVVTLSAASSGNNSNGCSISFTNVLQSESFHKEAGSSSISASSISDSVTTTEADCMCVDFVVHRNDSDITEDTGQTNRIENYDGSQNILGASTEPAASAGSVTMGWSWATSHSCVHRMVAIRPAAAAGRTTKNTRAFPLGTEIGMNWLGAA